MNAEESGPKFSMPVSHGSVTVRVNRITKANGYEYYQVRFYVDGQRMTKSCSGLAEAEKWAKDMAKKLHEGEGRVIHLHGHDRMAYLQAKAALPLNVPLELAVREYRLAHDLLGGKVSLLEAVRGFVDEKMEPVDPRPVPEIMNELLAVRKKDNKSAAHVKDLTNRLGKFAAKFTCPLSSVSASQIHDFLLSLDVQPRTRNNFRMAISNLVGFARQRRYVPRSYNPMPEVPRAEEVEQEVEIFSVEEMTRLLQHAKPALVPFLCLVAFGGLRHQEAAKLDWSDYRNGHIRVRAKIAKCRQSRLIKVQPNLAAWLEPHRKESGPVQPFANVTNELVDLAKAAGISWKHNALRHSFGSFSLAVVQDVKKVSYQMGNSVQMVFNHYRELLTEDEGKRWFSIMPTIAPNVVPMTAGPTSA